MQTSNYLEPWAFVIVQQEGILGAVGSRPPKACGHGTQETRIFSELTEGIVGFESTWNPIKAETVAHGIPASEFSS